MTETPKKREKSIGSRINSLVASSILLAMAVLAAVLALFELRDGVGARRAELEGTGFVYASAAAEAVASANKGEALKVLRSVTRIKDVLAVYAVDENGKTIASTGQAAILSSELLQGDPSIWNMLKSGSMAVSVDILNGGIKAGKLVLVGDLTNLRLRLLNTFIITLLSSVAAIAAALAFSKRLQKKITSPITQLTASIVRLRQAHSYAPTEINNADRETRELVDSFNGMVEEIRARDSALQKLAYFDTLTGLSNRVQFQKSLAASIASAKAAGPAFSVMLLDINNFKAINDTLGAVIGDAVLMSIAAQLHAAADARSEVARLGADEFGILVLDVTSVEEAQTALAPFVASLYQPLQILGHSIHVTANVGVALSAMHCNSGIDLQRQAHLALSAAKTDGNGRIRFFQPEFAERLNDEAELERGLRRAMAEGAFEIHFQPIITSATQTVEGFEALLRWQRADGRYVPPAKFIPVAERTGLIADLGFWILRESCFRARDWLEKGLGSRYVSVNVSAGQLMLSGFVDKLRRILAETRLPPGHLCIELTESIFIGGSVKMVKSILKDIKSLGVTIALDDFGTGYSSLSYLEGLSFDKLKIDRSFVQQQSGGANQRQLLKGIIDLAHALKISVVAEGAETLAEVSLLKSYGSEAIQGYFYSKPLPEAEMFAAIGRIEHKFGAVVGPPGLEPGTRRL